MYILPNIGFLVNCFILPCRIHSVRAGPGQTEDKQTSIDSRPEPHRPRATGGMSRSWSRRTAKSCQSSPGRSGPPTPRGQERNDSADQADHHGTEQQDQPPAHISSPAHPSFERKIHGLPGVGIWDIGLEAGSKAGIVPGPIGILLILILLLLLILLPIIVTRLAVFLFLSTFSCTCWVLHWSSSAFLLVPSVSAFPQGLTDWGQDQLGPTFRTEMESS